MSELTNEKARMSDNMVEWCLKEGGFPKILFFSNNELGVVHTCNYKT